ncbi:MAG: DUF4031 domain-containing protein [Desulfarculus sp.]|nr:DUF4031 domain-containing protein [Desulfarculus sp.]
MIISDGIHLACPGDVEALHRFAASIGLRREWFQDHPRHPHYDLKGRMFEKAFHAGAVRVTSKEMVAAFAAVGRVA